ncbi:MAG: SWIM zinc finger family protein [Geopsychrobacter sp.]|nr:SWIM zinc finger family protein [Geopsychrobacter sp.]
MPFSLTIQEIRRVCGQTYYQRGLNYQRQGRVLVAEWDDEGQMLFGEVKGSGRRTYQQEILFTAGSKHHFAGFCSCPVSNNCKHIVAVLLEWIELNLETFARQCNPDPLSLINWQQATRQLLHDAAHRSYPAPGEACLLYLLQPKTQGQTRVLQLKVLKSRHLKRGGWGKTTSCKLADLIGYYNPPAGARPVDKEIARLLSPVDRFGYTYDYNPPQIEGDIGILVLQRLLETGRCFFESIEHPALRLGPPRQTDFLWQEQGALTQLKICLNEKTDWVLIPTTPPWYLDRKTDQCGPLEQALDTPPCNP